MDENPYYQILPLGVVFIGVAATLCGFPKTTCPEAACPATNSFAVVAQMTAALTDFVVVVSIEIHYRYWTTTFFAAP